MLVSEEDLRKNSSLLIMDHARFILNTSANYFNLSQIEKTFDDSYVRDFLENDSQRVLSASLNETRKSIQFQNRIPNEYQNVLLFYKMNKSDAASDLGMLTLEGGIVKSIYNSLSSIFVPNAMNKNECSTDLIALIENLQTNLSVSLGVAETGITSIKDEIHYWRQKSQNSTTKSDKDAAKAFASQLTNLNDSIEEFMNLKSLQKLSSLEDLMDRVQYILDELWRIPNFQYPQNRMVSVIDVLSSMIVTCCVDDLNQQDDMWSTSSMNLSELIGHVMDIMNNWIQTCDSLTRLFWTNCDQHPWLGKPYIPSLMTRFKTRVEDILDIKQIHKQISILSTEDDTIDLRSRDYFYSFRDINIFDTTPIGEKYWKIAKNKFEQSLSNIDEKIAANIKFSIQNALNNPRQVIYIFSKYENILKRQKIKDALRIECDHLHQAVVVFVKQLTQALNEKKNHLDDDGDVSSLVSEIKWLKIIEYQVQQVVQICNGVLYDRNDYDELKKKLEEFQQELEQNLKQNFDQWCEQSMSSVVSGELVLKDNEPVVKFEKGERQLMTVTYNPKLLVFCQDLRHLKNFGFHTIPNELIKYGTIGKKYVKYARNLQQIANFHNTIGDRIIPCQRPIMLKSAMELSNLVKSQSVSWNNEESVRKYITVLQEAINQLSKDNNLLSGYHENMKKSIIKLMNTDLLKQSNVWKQELKTLRDSIATLEKKGYTNLNLFKLHWDYQLYKALEHQLILFLIDSKEKLPDINIDLVFRNQELQFRPTLEEIRYEYYTQIRKYVEMPLHFHGFSDNSNKLFRVMVERNRSKFKSLYDRAERNFKRLCEFRDLWLPWVSLGCVNLENLCQVHLSIWEDWDKNFKSCKNFSQKIAKIQKSEERIDCFVVNVSPVRSHIEFIARSFWETLSVSLRSSILEDNSILHEYITTALNVLQHIPNDDNGIIGASFKYERIVQELPRMTELLKSVQSKNTCLAGWCKENVGSLDSLIVQWEKLLPLIENHHMLLQGQLEVIKENLLGKINALNSDAEKFLIKWEDTLKDLESNADVDFEVFKERKSQWMEFIDRRDILIAECEKFNATFTKELNENFQKIENDIKKHGEQWNIFEDFLCDHEMIEQEEWSVYRRKPYIFADFLSKWENKTNNMITVPALRIKKQIEKFRSIMPTLTMLQSDSLSDKHWASIFNIIGLQPKSYHDIKLLDVLKYAPVLAENSSEVKSVINQAYSEQIVRQAINELEQWSMVANLKLFAHSDSRNETLMLIKEFQESLNKIGDNQCLLQSAKNTISTDSFMDQIELWENKLNILSYILNSLCQIQKKWIYLEPIFANGTLRNGDTSFNRIDKDFRYIMRDIAHNPKVVSLIKINNIQMIIESLLNQLQHCQNTLTTYMTGKRDLFPRFYFLSDDDLLEILGQASKENIIQKHINKLFPGIYKLELINDESKGTKVRSIKSSEGDNVQLTNVISTTDSVENWLTQLDNEIKSTLKQQIKFCYQRGDLNLETIEKFPMQILCIVNSINFTTMLEKSITNMSLSATHNSLKNDIGSFSSMLQGTKNALTQLKIRALLFDLVHHVTTVEYLMKHNVTNLNDWHWLQQIKFYFNPRTELISIKVVNAEFEYSYEFLGNYNKLVYTSLTHNCYLTLTQAMYLGLGGNPFGPAGTGKTECVKSLGAMLGRMVLVFNCNENIDTSAMALILTGISRCGAWACFDEFNRLQEETLSAIAMLIQPLQIALKEKQEIVHMLDKNIPLNPHSCVFVTLNPADEDYGGRNQLPSNLQALFRPIVMQQPEPKEIAKVMLFIEGFRNAEEIGKRIVELFDLSNKLLSPQRHYDWGLRELKTVLSACGKALAASHASSNADFSIKDEMEIVVQSLKPNVMSKLTLNDCKRFKMLLEDVFPQLNITSDMNEEFRNKVEETFTMMGFAKNERQIDKCIELYEQLNKRIGVAVYGPPCSGKSTIISVLKSVLSSMQQTIRTYTISPKSMERSQLLGKLDINTRQWHDGVLTQTAIAVNSESQNVISWIICDGDVDPEWIEALNSVLDDNKLLTLPSGWRIQFGSNVNFIFETHDLANASPATISRMGIVKFSPEDLPAMSIVESWINKHQNNEILQRIIDKYFENIMNEFESVSKVSSQFPKISVVRNVLNVMPNIDSQDEFIVELIKSLNAMIEPKNRNNFTNSILDQYSVYTSDPTHAEYLYFNKFRNIVDTYQSDESTSVTNNTQAYTTSLFKTASVKSTCDLLRNVLKNPDKPAFILSGPSGNGKSLMINSIVSEFSGYQLVTVNCSTQLNAAQILQTLKQNYLVVSGIRGKEYKPKQSRLILFMKNIDLCPIDSWGTSEVIELLLQIMNRNGFYSESLEWISISGLQICATLTDITKQNLSTRFLSKCNIFMTSYPNENDMQNIIVNFLSYIYNKNNSIIMKKEKLCEIMLEIFNEIRNNFTSDMSNHYKFTPKMIEQWIIGLTFYPDDQFSYAFFYELSKIFCDRLMNIEHNMIFTDIIRNNLKHFSCKFDSNETFFMQTSTTSSQLQMIDAANWKEMLEKNLPICNSETAIIDLPVTNELMRTVASMVRALSRSGTNVCLAGKLGSGRFESTVLACSLLNIKIFYPQVTRNYSQNEFINDLRLIMQTCGIDNEIGVFYIDQIWINYFPEILKFIEAILEDSFFANDSMFGDDLETVANSLKGAAQLEGYQESLVSFFLKRVKKNLHFIVSLETTTVSFQETLKTYKSLYSKTEFIWLPEISVHTKQILCESVIKLLKNDANLTSNAELSTKYFENIINDCGFWIDSPKRSIQLIKSYYLIHIQTEKKKMNNKMKLELGIQKLSDAYKYVARLKDDAKEKEKALAEKRQLANQALEMISTTMKSANDRKSDMLKLKTKTEENGEILKQRKLEIEQELSLVEPLLKEASAAVGSIKTEALSEIRSLRAPPETIRDILEGVLRLMGIKDTSWNSMKSFLAKRGVKEDIRSLNPSLISPENCAQVERLIESKPESFDSRNAKRASAAAAPLASWVLAIVKYSKVVQSIKPLEREQNELERNLEQTENQMKSLSSGIDDVNVKVKELSEQLNGYTQEAAVLEIKLEETRKTLQSTEVLVEKLSSEYSNWTTELEAINYEIKDLDKQSIMIALCITHFSHMLEEERTKYLMKICENLHLKFDLHDAIYTDQDKIVWESMGLSSDKQSIENAALILKYFQLPFTTSPIPLILDPTGSAAKWLREYLKSKSSKFEILNQNDDRFTYNLELAVRFGKILIVDDITTNFTASLLSLLAMKIHSRFNKKMLHVGNKFIDLHEDFRLILTTSNDIKHLSGEINANVTIIPFTLTSSGFTDQLLSKWISIKHPETEKKRIALLQNEGKLMQEKIYLQDKLLEELSHAEGDILKNEKLLATLNQIKESSADIEKSLNESHDIRVKLLENYNEYKDICSQAASFYVKISKIYELNPKSYTRIFLDVLEKQKEYGEIIDPFVKIVKKTYLMLNLSIRKLDQSQLGLNVCRCAFNKKIPDSEWESFIFNFADAESVVDPTIPKWVKKELIPKLSTLKTQHGALYQKLNLENEFDWQKFIDATENVQKSFPNVQLTDFQRLLIYQIFRPDQLLNVINNVTANMLSLRQDAFTQSGMKQLLTEVESNEAILVIAYNGADPTNEIKEFAKSINNERNFVEIYIGKGQESTNLNLVLNGAEEGKIICVKNIHLMPQFMQTLDLKLKTINISAQFKLIYVCETDKNIPKHLTNKCKKLLMEPPNGIKHKIFDLLEQNYAAVKEIRDYRHMKPFIALFILHSILQERRSFIPQGWCKWYEFGDSDVKAAIDYIRAVNGKSYNVDWTVLKGLIEKIIYGGRVDNFQDFEKLVCMIQDYFDSKVMNPKWTPKSLNISIPNANNVEEYQSALMKMEGNDSKPEIFGLSSTSSLSRNITVCRNLLKDLRKIHFNIDDSENYEKRIKPLIVMWRKFVNVTNIEALSKVREDSLTDVNPWRLFKTSEIFLASKLSNKISETLQKFVSIDLNSISDSDKSILITLSDNSVPYDWRKLWQGPKMASEFLKSVSVRIQNVSKYLHNIDDPIDEIDFSKIFNVDSFLSTLKLVTSRDMNVSASDLIMDSFIEETKFEIMQHQQNKVIKVAPLQIDGLGIENNMLVSSEGFTVKNFTGNIFIYFKEFVKGIAEEDSHVYAVPLYSTYSREKLLCTLKLNTRLDSNDIIYSGTALIVPSN